MGVLNNLSGKVSEKRSDQAYRTNWICLWFSVFKI